MSESRLTEIDVKRVAVLLESELGRKVELCCCDRPSPPQSCPEEDTWCPLQWIL